VHALFVSPRISHAARTVVAALALLALLIPSGADAQARSFANVAPTNVDVALVLAVDASQSMDQDEQALQRDGYVGALTSEEVLTAISYGRHRRIAVAYFEWGSLDQQVLIAPWTIIDGPEAAKAFTSRIAAAPLVNLQRTSISAAMTFAGELFTRSGVNATRKVVDISGDGPNNQGLVVSEARDALIQQGVTINGLPIVVKDAALDWNPIPQLDRYYEDCVIGGEGSFSIPVKGMTNFGTALKMKLVLEIAGLTLDQPKVIPAAMPVTNCRYYE
jgi:hypothetical protein